MLARRFEATVNVASRKPGTSVSIVHAKIAAVQEPGSFQRSSNRSCERPSRQKIAPVATNNRYALFSITARAAIWLPAFERFNLVELRVLAKEDGGIVKPSILVFVVEDEHLIQAERGGAGGP